MFSRRLYRSWTVFILLSEKDKGIQTYSVRNDKSHKIRISANPFTNSLAGVGSSLNW